MPEPPEWVRDYIGIPWSEHGRTREGSDCWGLLCLVLSERFNIQVPTYDEIKYEGHKQAKDLGDVIAKHPEMNVWSKIPLEEVVHGDCLLLRVFGSSIHVSIVVAPGLMLHIEKGINSFIERYNGPLWEHRISGAYRHESVL